MAALAEEDAEEPPVERGQKECPRLLVGLEHSPQLLPPKGFPGENP